MKWSEQVREMVGLCSVMTVATASTLNWQFLSIQQGMLKRVHAADWFQVVGVARIQGYQASVLRKKKGMLVSSYMTVTWGMLCLFCCLVMSEVFCGLKVETVWKFQISTNSKWWMTCPQYRGLGPPVAAGSSFLTQPFAACLSPHLTLTVLSIKVNPQTKS